MKVCIKIGDVYIALDSVLDADGLAKSAQFYTKKSKYSDDLTLVPYQGEVSVVMFDNAVFRDESKELLEARETAAKLRAELEALKRAATPPVVSDVVAAMEKDTDGDDCAP